MVWGTYKGHRGQKWPVEIITFPINVEGIKSSEEKEKRQLTFLYPITDFKVHSLIHKPMTDPKLSILQYNIFKLRHRFWVQSLAASY